MANLNSYVADLIDELKNIQGLDIIEIAKDDPFRLPRMIAVGNAGGIIVSQKMDELIEIISRELKMMDASLALRVKDEEWVSTVRAAFGPALTRIDLDIASRDNVTSVLDDVRRSLVEKPSEYGKREFVFGCTLFSEETVISRFAIGPVGFEPRLNWLARKSAEGDVSSISRRRIERKWQGDTIAKRKSSIDSMREKSILDVIGRAPYACSVSTSGLAKEAGLEKALTVARLALSSISLIWRMPSKALDGFNLTYDRTVIIQRALTFVPGKTQSGF